MENSPFKPVPQDLHIHTTFSTGDSSIVPEQTLSLISETTHARVIGICDHATYVAGKTFEIYKREVRSYGFKLGVEINGAGGIESALEMDTDYYIYHCPDSSLEYKGIDTLLLSGKPIIIAHPLFLGTNLNKVPPECYIEINNRYIWRSDWKTLLPPFKNRFSFIISSDAHQPHWLNQNVARHVSRCLGIEETLLFD